MKRVANTGELFDDPDTPIKWVEVEEQDDCRCEKRLNILKTVHKLLNEFKEDQAYEYLTAKLKEETGE